LASETAVAGLPLPYLHRGGGSLEVVCPPNSLRCGYR
jgi:hypothetical protein